MKKPSTIRRNSTRDAGVFAVFCCMTANTHRHSPTFHSEGTAQEWYEHQVAEATQCPDIMQVSLCRYTSGKTELLDEWLRIGTISCDLHSVTRTKFSTTRKVAA